MIEVAPMTEAAARSIALWRYEPPYDFYDRSEAEVLGMLDQANRYFAIRADGDLVGYVCVGPDARVSDQQADPETDDIGWGFRPDLTGRGMASRWLAAVLELLDGVLRAETQRVVIAAWNQRSQTTAHRLGFGDPATFSNNDGEWLVLTRPATGAP